MYTHHYWLFVDEVTAAVVAVGEVALAVVELLMIAAAGVTSALALVALVGVDCGAALVAVAMLIVVLFT